LLNNTAVGSLNSGGALGCGSTHFEDFTGSVEMNISLGLVEQHGCNNRESSSHICGLS
jgi:hypothetical protein